MKRYWLFFALLSVIYHSNLRPISSADSMGTALVPFAMMLDGSLRLDRFGSFVDAQPEDRYAVVRAPDGHWYSSYPIAGAVLATPLYFPVALIPALRRLPASTLVAIARIAEKFVAVIFAAASAVALLILLRRITTPRIAWILTLIFALATGNWSTSSQAMWPHTTDTLAILACFYAIARWPTGESRWYWMAGLAAGCAVAIRATNLALAPALVLALWSTRASFRHYVRVFLAPAAAACAAIAYNILIFDRASGIYPPQLDGTLIAGLAGILVSPGRGLLLYTPVAIFALAAFFPAARRSSEKYRPLVIACAAFSLVHIAIISRWPDWWGGYCWGPRLLTEILPALMILIAAGWSALHSKPLRAAFAIAAAWGFFIQAAGVYCYPEGHWDNTPASVELHPERNWNWRDNPLRRTIRAGIAWEPYAILITGIKDGLPAAARKMHDLGIHTL